VITGSPDRRHRLGTHEQARDGHPRSAIEGVGGIEADGDLDEQRNAADAGSDAMPGRQKACSWMSAPLQIARSPSGIPAASDLPRR